MISLDKEFYYRVQQDDDESILIARFNTCRENIYRNDSTIPLYVGEWVRIKVNNYRIHIVRPMDTLDKIASQYGVSVDVLIRDNNLQTNRLFIGQVIKIYTKT